MPSARKMQTSAFRNYRAASREINEISILCNRGENALLTMFALSDRTRHVTSTYIREVMYPQAGM